MMELICVRCGSVSTKNVYGGMRNPHCRRCWNDSR